jgi:hypothetical protein
MIFLKMYLKEHLFETNKENSLHIANTSCNPRKISKRGKIKRELSIAITTLVTQ